MRLSFFIEALCIFLIGIFIIQTIPHLPAVSRSILALNYHPPQEIADLATKAQMTDQARAIFYRTQPVIDTNRNVFEAHCQTPVSSNLVELGCYTGDDRIYIMKISDPSLADEMVVVAAHEMLHAAYAQLSKDQINSLQTQLEPMVKKLNSPTLNQELKNYRLTEPGQRDNELHSLLGTEYSPLSPALETYYKTYFLNRNVVVGYANQVNQIFDSLQTQLNNLEQQIRNDRGLLDSYLSQGDITNYNYLVSRLNKLINSYNQTVDRYNQLSRSLAGVEQPAQAK